jgi:hypothetical protein
MNRILYLGLVEIAKTILDGKNKPVFKQISMWNNQLDNAREGLVFDFRKPALFFEFMPEVVDAVGAGVQVFDPLPIRIHIIDELFDAKDGTNEVNLQVFDLGDLIYKKFQLNSVKGNGYGTSTLNRSSVELDVNHDNMYHHITTFTTTWTDNSAKQPAGGYEIDPPLIADITIEKVQPFIPPVINVAPLSIDFGNVTVGQSATQTFTIDGTGLTEPVIISSSYGLFQVSLSTNFSTRLIMSPDNGVLISTLVTVKFTPNALGAFTGNINYGIPGLNGEITLTGMGI